MNEQLPTTTNDDQSGLDRRKFLLRTTALTAGAWAAPSVLTIDRAFGAPGSPAPCCGPNTVTDAATVKGAIVVLGQQPITVRQNACLNDDTLGTNVPLPSGLGSVAAGGASCEACGASVNTGAVSLILPGGATSITADVLQSHAACHCDTGHAEGGSKVVGLDVGGTTVAESTSYQAIPIPFGTVHLNQGPGDPAGTPGEFNAVHIVYSDGVNSVDLKLASSKVTCA